MAEQDRLSLGALELPGDWDISLEATLRGPAATEGPALLAGRRTSLKDAPRPTLLLQRRPAPEDAAKFLQSFLESSAGASSELKLEVAPPLVFSDATEAKCYRVELGTIPPVSQLHLCRVDDGWMTHFVLATTASDTAGLKALRELVATWRPR